MLNLKEMIHLDTMMKTGNILAGIAGALLVPTFEYLYGEGEVVKYLMTALVFFVAMDWISGVRASKKENSYGSKYGIDGIFRDRKSTRLNSSHVAISYAVFCLKKKINRC